QGPQGPQGPKGDKGVAYPTAVQVASVNYNPNTISPVTVDVYFNNNQLKANDYITFYWYNNSTTDKYLVAGQVTEVKSVNEYSNGMCLIRFEILLNSVYYLDGQDGANATITNVTASVDN